MRRTGLFVGLLLMSVAGCHSGDEERLSRIWHRLSDRAASGIGEARRHVAAGWSAFRERSPSSSLLREQVESRLRLDKLLTSLAIEIESEGTTVTLRGTVTDAELRKRAVELTQQTVGVEQVVDELGPKE